MQTPEIPRWGTCCARDCTRPVVRKPICTVCRRAFCILHQLTPYHNCPLQEPHPAFTQAMWNDEVRAVEMQINIEALLAACRSLNENRPCTLMQYGQRFLLIGGEYYYQATILFDDDDDTMWIAEIPRLEHGRPEPWKCAAMVLNEFATLEYLHSVPILTPRVYGYGLATCPTNMVGVSYLLREYLPGIRYDHVEATPANRVRIIQQMAYYLTELGNRSFASCGSLFPQYETEPQMATIKRNLITSCGEVDLVPPARTSLAYFRDLASNYVDLIADGQLYHRYPREVFTIYDLFRNDTGVLWHDLATSDPPYEEAPEHERFYLKNVNDNGFHILVDQDYNITGIIDWQFSRIVPACEAFAPTLFNSEFMYGYEPLLRDTYTYLGEVLDHLGSQVIARHLRSGDMVRRFCLVLSGQETAEQVRDISQAVVSRILQHKNPRWILDLDDVRWWLTATWTMCRDTRKQKVQALLRDMSVVGTL